MVLGVLRPPRCIPVTWRLVRGQVWSNGKTSADCPRVCGVLFGSIFFKFTPVLLHFPQKQQCLSVISDGQRFYPTSPLRDYTGSPARRKRSQSAGVRFKKDATRTGDGVSSAHRPTANQCCLLPCHFRKLTQEEKLKILAILIFTRKRELNKTSNQMLLI